MPLDFRTARAGLHEDDVTRDVVVIAGKDPTLIDGGAESYLRAYGRAAMSAGFFLHPLKARAVVRQTSAVILIIWRVPCGTIQNRAP